MGKGRGPPKRRATASKELAKRLAKITPARLEIGRAGPRYTTSAWLEFRADHARARDAVTAEVSTDWVIRNRMIELTSCAQSREQFLLKPDLGRRLSKSAVAILKKKFAVLRDRRRFVILCVGDGLSSLAVETNAGRLVRLLARRLKNRYEIGAPIFVRNARVRIQDHIGELLSPKLVCMLVGERPGLKCAESLSAYVIYKPTLKSLEPDRTVISNIHRGGLKVEDAAKKISQLIDDAMRLGASGAALSNLTANLIAGQNQATKESA
jgi:ethanolamine ammonia-lyase small subunit